MPPTTKRQWPYWAAFLSLFFLFSLTSSAQQALDQEPEVKQIAALEQHFHTIAPSYGQAERQAIAQEQAQRQAQGKQPSMAANTGAGISAAGGAGLEMINTLKAESILWNRLDARLRDQLIACQGKCPKMAVMEQEYAEMKKRKLAHEKEMDSLSATFGMQPKPSSAESSLEERRQAQVREQMARSQKYSDAQLLAGQNLEARCREKAGLPKRGSLEDQQNSPTVFTPVKVAAYQACVKQGPAASDAPSSNLARTHVDAMKACASFYNFAAGEFRQQAYDNCMNQRDAMTQQCTAQRRASGKKGVCLGEPPPAASARR